MYTAVLMLAMTSGPEAIEFGRRGCNGCSGCCSSYGCSGCSGGRSRRSRSGCCGCGGYYGGGYANYYGPGPYYASGPGPYYASGPGYSPGMAMTGSATQVRQSNYLNPNQQTAMVRILLPANNADVWFDNTATKQRGTDRMFVSAPLDSGGNYTYTVKAHWTQDGKSVDRERHVTVQPGQEVTVDFRLAPTGEKLSAPKASSATPPK